MMIPPLPTSILAASTRRRDSGETLSALAYRRIRDKIVRLELPPAAVIDESALAEELGIGLTPIRQALRRLALENLVVILPRRGTLVADLNTQDLEKIFEIRLELETLAARLAAQRATPNEIQTMRELLALADQDPPEEYAHMSRNEWLLHLDREAHRRLALAAHNEFLAEILDWLYCHVMRLWYVILPQVETMDQAMEEHRQLVGALEAGDPERAEAIMHDHVSSFQEEVLRKM